MARLVMVGSGYVGLVSGACLSDFGHTVVCVDKDAAKIALLEKGEMPIYEPGLAELVIKNVRGGRLSFSLDLAGAVAGADAVFIAVGTPSRRGDGHADLSYVYAAAREIAASLTGYCVIVTKSTVPVGTETRSSGSSGRRGPTSSSPSFPIPSSCVRARPSPTSSGRTASSSARATSAPGR